MPWATICASHSTDAPFCKAARAAAIAFGLTTSVSITSTMPHACATRAASAAWSGAKRFKSRSLPIVAKER
jgi:hypothetical protein